MASPSSPDLRYPIGKFTYTEPNSESQRTSRIVALENLPSQLRAAVASLNDQQLDTPYRPGGWTVRQLVHHVADSHINSYVRFRLALTEDNPTIKPYDEAKWAELSDAKKLPVSVSLDLLETLHSRWVSLLHALSAEEYKRELLHPESGAMTLDRMLALYAWHGDHHTAHVMKLRERENW